MTGLPKEQKTIKNKQWKMKKVLSRKENHHPNR